MDIEFHYYMTYLIAARAGFAPAEAAILAQAAQEIDDNHIPISVSKGTPAEYESVISQTMDILRPKHNERIYPIFHFIPGDPAAPSAKRKDGTSSLWVTIGAELQAGKLFPEIDEFAAPLGDPPESGYW